MNKHSAIDYLGCILFRLLASLIRFIPRGTSLFLGRRLGDLFYYFDLKHKSIAYANIKTAFGRALSPGELSRITHGFYRNFGQSIIETFFIPFVDKGYIDKYISFEGREFIEEAFKKQKGVIFLAVHSGSWEFSSIVFASLGFPFNFFVRGQRYPRLNSLLNLYRAAKGCKIIQRQNQTRRLIELLKNNEAVGLTVDQGGESGLLVKFFGKNASLATGAVRLALKYDCSLLPAFHTRVSGPYIKTIIRPPFEIKKTGDTKKDVADNLQEIIKIFEEIIAKYSKDYFWPYKIWKYSDEKNVLILDDGKTGHLRQSQAVVNILDDLFGKQGCKVNIETREIKFKGKLSKYALTFSGCLSGKYHCQGCLWCLRQCLQRETYNSLLALKPDMIISCGSSIAAVNYVLARENLAKSIVIMQPSILSTRRFDLAIIPKHDNPPARKNIVTTIGALNLIDEQYLKEQSQELARLAQLAGNNLPLTIGLLIGGDTKGFKLNEDTILEVIGQIKSVAEKFKANLLATTSRRTSRKVEAIVKEEFKGYARCRLLVIANEKNIAQTVGGILGLSDIIICSAESISMISEAASSKKYVLVFKSEGLGKKHRRFLDNLAQNKCIYLVKADDLSKKIEIIWQERPAINSLSDNSLVREAIKKLL